MNDVREDLKAYLDGELSEVRAAIVAAALESDPTLREELEALRAIGEGIREVALNPAVQGYEKTLSAVRRRTPWWRRALPVAATLGAAIVVVAVVTPFYAQMREEGDTAATVAMVAPAEAPAGALRDSSGLSYENGAQPAAPAAGAPSNGMNAEKAAAAEGSRLPADADWAKAAQPPVPPEAERLVVKNGDMTLRVDDALEAKARAVDMAAALGGYVESSGQSTRRGGLPVAMVTLRVPARQFETALDRLRHIEEGAEELSSHTSGDDVTGVVADTEARLRVLRGEEEQYVTILGETRKIGDVLAVKERLSDVRQQIESLEAQRKVMRDQAALSTIVATFEQRESVGQPAPSKSWAGDTWSSAVNGLGAALTALGRAAIFVFVYAPIWLPIVLLGGWLVHRWRR
ncbi:MAG: DUF4349 domain-containing protein [Fimbriimonadaceae bacterium]|nr:DUF4349 domain-containing protein [Fimbriimonadaceae bacterium]